MITRTIFRRTTHPSPNLIVLRYISKDIPPPQESPSSSVSSPDEVQSAIVERMKQILEEKISTQSSSTLNNMKQADNGLKQILSQYETPQYTSSSSSLPNQKQAAAYIKSEPLLAHNKHAKEIYNSQPWTGNETTYDSNLRMILDKTPKPKSTPNPMSNNNNTNPLNLGLQRKRSNNEKLAMARDVSLDYKINKTENKNKNKKNEGADDDDDDGFREMYREKLLGPSMLINHNTSSIDFVESLAGNKINASINQTTGKFDGNEMNKVRGKPLNKEHLKNCTDSNYFMNQILKKQEVKPVWIENQQSLQRNINEFRNKIDEMWFRWIIYDSDEISHIVQNASIIETIENSFEKNIVNFTTKTKGDEFNDVLHESDLKYIEKKVELLNQEIRNYNLQCPSVSGHKFKLQKDKEIKESYWRSLENFPLTLQIWFDKHKTQKKSRKVIMEYKDKSGNGFLNIWGDSRAGRGTPQEIHVNRDVDTKLHVWKAIKDVFTLSK